MTGLGWIDFSTEHRNKVLEIIDSMGDTGTLDQLGVGVVRDSLANWMFPGISTIQTRAKYFILIPQIFQKYLKGNFKKEKLGTLRAFCKKEEKKIIDALAKNSPNAVGIIGISTANKNRELKTYPSVIYWTGLRVHNIIGSDLSLNDYLQLNNLEKGIAESYESEIEQDDFSIDALNFNVNMAHLTLYDLEDLRIELTASEAQYLKEKFVLNKSNFGVLLKEENNLLRLLIEHEELLQILLDEKIKTFQDFATKALSFSFLPDDTREVMEYAQKFYWLMHGAHIRYNMTVHKLHGNQDYTNDWEIWQAYLIENMGTYANLNLDKLFVMYAPNTSFKNRHFIKEWQRLLIEDIENVEELDKLVFFQEIQNKSNPKQRKEHEGEYTDWIGIKQMDFRFQQVKNILKDIYNAKG